MNSGVFLSICILASGLFLSLAGFKVIQEEQIKLLPLNRRKTLVGEPARKAGIRLLIVGFITMIVGLIFLVIPS